MNWFTTNKALRAEVQRLARLNDHLHAENKELIVKLIKCQDKVRIGDRKKVDTMMDNNRAKVDHVLKPMFGVLVEIKDKYL